MAANMEPFWLPFGLQLGPTSGVFVYAFDCTGRRPRRRCRRLLLSVARAVLFV